MEKLKILAISGSLRKDSYNWKALQIAKRFAAEPDSIVEEIDLKELNLPFYDNNQEVEGPPEPVRKLKAAIEAADVLLIAAPEYNYSISAVLKNMIDWGSRKGNSFNGKFAVIFGASTGPSGTLRAQNQLRLILTAVNVFVLPQPQVFIRHAKDVFDEKGELKDEKVKEQLKKLVEKTLVWARKLKDSKQ